MRTRVGPLFALVTVLGFGVAYWLTSRATSPRADQAADARPALPDAPPPLAAPPPRPDAAMQPSGDRPSAESPPGAASRVHVVDAAHPGTITGVVRGPDGKPAAKATVRIVPAASEERTEVVRSEAQEAAEDERLIESQSGDAVMVIARDADDLFYAVAEDGTFRIDGLRLDVDWEVIATAPDPTSTSPAVDVRLTLGALERHVELALRRPSSLVVHVEGPSGFSMPLDARIRVFRGGDFESEQVLDAGHVARFDPVDPGPVKLLATGYGVRPLLQRVTIVEGAATDVRLSLDPGSTVDGVVVDEAGRPIPGASVTVAPAAMNETIWDRALRGGKTVSTNEQGRFSVGGVPPGAVLLVANRLAIGGRVASGTRSPVPLTAPVAGVRVVVGPLGRATVRLSTPDRQPYRGDVFLEVRRESGSSTGRVQPVDGAAEVPPLDDGVYSLLFAPTGYAWVRREVLVKDGSFADLGEFILDPGVDLIGRVLDFEGRPLKGAKVEVLENHRLDVETDGEGRFRIEHFRRASEVVVFGAEGYASEWLDVLPREGVPLEVRIGHPVTLSGSIKTAAGTPATKYQFEFRRPDAKHVLESHLNRDGSTSEADYCAGAEWPDVEATGKFRASIAPGRWVGIWHEGSDRERRIGEWTFADGETRELEIVLPPK